MVRKIKAYEPIFFIFFGVFHLHRIWGLIDREAYSNFWIGVMKNRGIFYCFLMAVLTILCLCGIVTFFKNRKNNYWWRWIYLFGGAYLLFDLFAIATGLKFWEEILLEMFNVSSPYWNTVWLSFILLGGFSFVLGIKLLSQRKRFLSV